MMNQDNVSAKYHNYENVENETKTIKSDKSKPNEHIEMASCVAYGEVKTAVDRENGKGEAIAVYETVN